MLENLGYFLPLLAILGPYCPFLAHNGHWAHIGHFGPILAILGHFWLILAILDLYKPILAHVGNFNNISLVWTMVVYFSIFLLFWATFGI